MKAKSILLTVPLTVSALTFLTLPADAVCWSWKPCADQQGYGYGAPTESQAVLPPLPADGSVPPGSTAAPGGAPGATAAPGHRVSGTAEACQEASGDGDRSATTCAGGEAEAKTGSSAGTGRSASGPTTCTTSGTRTCSGKSSIASGASTGPRPASGTSAAACAYASPGEGSTASARQHWWSRLRHRQSRNQLLRPNRHPLRRQRRGPRRSCCRRCRVRRPCW